MDIGKYFIEVKELPQTTEGLVQLLFLGGTYGYILCYASNLISDGSELLLLIPSMAGIIGSVVLPMLGAVPDGCMVLFSGLGPEAQEQLDVGIGTLAGSTIMLLTIPWFLSILGGRVNLDKKGVPNYKGTPKLTPPGNFDLFNNGVQVSDMVHTSAYVMLLTSLTYLVIQIPGMYYLEGSRSEQAAGEKKFAQFGAGLCVLFFVGYMTLQYRNSGAPDTLQDKTRDEYIAQAIAAKKVTLLGVMLAEYKAELRERLENRATSPYHKVSTADETTSFSPRAANPPDFSDRYMKRLRKILRPFFRVYDADDSNSLQIEELRVLFEDMGEKLTRQEVADLFDKFDADKNGSIDYDEFVQGVCEFILTNEQVGSGKYRQAHRLRGMSNLSRGDVESGEESEDEEEDEIPDDLKALSPEQQQRRIKLRSLGMMGLGTAIVIIISDPMVDVLSEIGVRTGIPAFYIAFVLAPMASNASELVAAYNYAQKKTRTSISISLATLLGAAIMNNTFVLGIFMLLVCTQNLSWEFFAETLAILIVQFIIGMFAFKRVHTLIDGFMILSLYPLSLMLVYVLQAYGWD
mmetsp:Transcript_35920/g.61852  ORF Transcript_35920/g.61852 Transcript_35920/m.61852 type:complete len:575 (-) Transcript_35920:547-2271(-)